MSLDLGRTSAAVLAGFIGQDLGTVTVLELIGQGTMGAVFRGVQRTLRRQVAVKVLPKTSLTNNAERLNMFIREAEFVAGLSHPHIIAVFEVGETPECYFQVMQFIDGANLETVIRRHRRHPVPAKRMLPMERSIGYVGQVLDGLAYAHGRGIVHQDMKPENVLIEEENDRALIADFGIARALRSGILIEDVIAGSPLYLAPEVAQGLPSDPRSDIYAAGMMLYRLTAQSLPLATHDQLALVKMKTVPPYEIFTVRPSVASSLIDEHLERIIMTAIEPDPPRRYQACREFADDLRAYHMLYLPPPRVNRSPG